MLSSPYEGKWVEISSSTNIFISSQSVILEWAEMAWYFLPYLMPNLKAPNPPIDLQFGLL